MTTQPHESDLTTNLFKIRLKFVTWQHNLMNVIWQPSTYSDKEVDHEEDVKCEIHLLGGAHRPGVACLHTIISSGKETHCLIQ